MRVPRRDRPASTEIYAYPQGRSILSIGALALSTLSLLLSGFTLTQIFALRQAINNINKAATPAPQTTSTVQIPSSSIPMPPPVVAPVPTVTVPATNTDVQIQPGQYIQPAFGTKGRVELLAVKRIQNPDTGSRDVVNVQMRIRRVAQDRVYGSDMISVSGTTARNPATSETYNLVNLDRSTGSVSLFTLRPSASADAYAWLLVPETVNTIDIYVPDTQAFKNVPIAN